MPETLDSQREKTDSSSSSSIGSDVSLVDINKHVNEEDYEVEDGSKRIKDMHDKLRKSSQSRI